jgi:Flp pilus assembly protein TadG
LLILRNEKGSTTVESVGAILFLTLLMMGVVHVGLVLYARNVLAASAHEGARAGLELGRTEAEAQQVARVVVRRAAGRAVRDLQVSSSTDAVGSSNLFTVQVSGRAASSVLFPSLGRISVTASVTRRHEVP